MATLGVIRRWALREQMSIREIARRTDLSRNTVKKYLRAGELEQARGRGHQIEETAAQSAADPHNQALIHAATPLGSQSEWVSIQWKFGVRIDGIQQP